MKCRLLTSVAAGLVSAIIGLAQGAIATESATLIRIAVFKDFVSSRSTKRPEVNPMYSIYFLDVRDEKEREELKNFFKTNTPPVECGTNSIVVKDGVVLDKRTNKSARLFSVEVGTVSNKKATVYAYAYAAQFGGECYAYELRLRSNRWVVSKKHLSFLQ